MGILTDHEIRRRIDRGDIVISPYDPSRIGPNSYDCMVEPRLLAVDPPLIAGGETTGLVIAPDGRGRLTLTPGRLYLGTTAEVVWSPADLVPYIDGRSSLGRLGVNVHCTAGRGDRGFRGRWTLEIWVVVPVVVRFDVPWCQLTWHTVEGDTAGGYQGRYQGQAGIVPSRL